MSSAFDDGNGRGNPPLAHDSIELLLVDSLIHHLIEKGLLTRNDALALVQAAAEVVAGRSPASDHDGSAAKLERLYLSFDAIPQGRPAAPSDSHNVRRLRPPLHGDSPRFPARD